MKLTFTKDFPWDKDVFVSPITVDGENIEDVISCTVESQAQSATVMTLKIFVREQLSDQVARRLKGKPVL